MGEPNAGAVQVARELIEDAPVPVLQPALFPAEDIAALGELRGCDRADALRKRGAGRPAGAVNKRTKDFRDYVLSRGPHPVDVLIETYARPAGDLALELGCTLLEAKRLQNDAARTVMEYTEQKMPVRVDHQGNGGITLVFENGSTGNGTVLEGEFIQPLSAPIDGELEDGELENDR